MVVSIGYALIVWACLLSAVVVAQGIAGAAFLAGIGVAALAFTGAAIAGRGVNR